MRDKASSKPTGSLAKKQPNQHSHRRRDRQNRDSNIFSKLRVDIVEEGKLGQDVVHCPAFTAPLMDFGDQNDSDQEDYSADAQFPAIVSAKKKWKKLFQIILEKKSFIPLKQMAIKKKHEDLIFEKM